MSRRTPLIVVLLGVGTVLIYAQTFFNDFVGYDDPEYVTRNEHVRAGLTADGVRWAFSTLKMGNWNPLVWLSHMALCQFFGVKPAVHHAASVACHVANTMLLYALLLAMTAAPWRSAGVAALFAWHPLHVEAVAWVSARKDTVSTFFMMLTLLAYAYYARSHRIGWYAAVLVSFALALMSKSMVVTLPAVLLLLDYWPLRRWRGAAGDPKRGVRLVVEKLPLVAMGLATMAVTFVAQKDAGALTVHISLRERLANAVWACGAYLGKTVWPTGLAAFYPHPAVVGGDVWGLRFIAPTVALIGITSIVVWQARRRPYLLVGWLWYLGTLIPVIGIVQLGLQAMADRYTYVPLIGVFIAVAWLAGDLVARYPAARRPVVAVFAAVLFACGITTAVQVTHWRDTTTLFAHAAEVTEDNFVAHYFLGMEMSRVGRTADAARHYAEAVRALPGYLDAQVNLGAALEILGDRAGAERHYRAALAIAPDDPDARANLEALLAREASPATQPAPPQLTNPR